MHSDSTERLIRPPRSRRRNEVAGAAGVVASAVDILSRPVEGTHRAISDAVFGALGAAGLRGPATPARLLHDAISTATYSAVRGGAAATASVVTLGSAALPAARTEHAVTSSATGSVVVGAVNGLLGDRLVAEGNDLAVTFGHHHQRRVVGAERALVTEAFPEPTGHLVVLAHGLGETEQAWFYRHGGRGSYGQLLAGHGVSAVALRYNTGTAIAANGVSLAGLLAELVAVWPVPVTRIDLVGHSMGGLVVRHACAADTAARWLPLVRTALYLGTPHEGAPLAAGTRRLSRALRRVPRADVWSDLLDVRSRGIEDLVRPTTIPLVDGVRHVGVAATLARDPDAWWSDALGDGLVTPASARGPLREVHTLPGTGHLSLLSDPRVADVLLDLVTDAPPAVLEQAADPA